MLTDGREISVPLSEVPELVATPEQRANWDFTDFGTAIWPDMTRKWARRLLGVPETLLEEAAGFTIANREPRSDTAGQARERGGDPGRTAAADGHWGEKLVLGSRVRSELRHGDLHRLG